MRFFHVTFLVTECDALTGCKISSLDIGARVVRMSYSPTSGHAVIAMLEVGPLYMKIFNILEFFSPFFSTVIFFFNKEPNFIDINEIIKAIVFVERWRCHVRRFGRLLGLMPPCRHYELGSILLDWSPFL